MRTEAKTATVRAEPGSGPEPARVLLAVADGGERERMRQQLADQGLPVDVADRGPAAVVKAAAADYRLILLDVAAPQMAGVATCRAIRALPGHRATPILALTAGSEAADRRAYLEAGFTDCVAPPLVAERLLRTVRGGDGGQIPTTPPPDSLDLGAIAAALCISVSAMHDLALLFLEATRRERKALDMALAGRDWAVLRHHGHRFKSTAWTLGAAGLGQRYQQLETCGSDADAARAAALLGDIWRRLERLEAELETGTTTTPPNSG